MCFACSGSYWPFGQRPTQVAPPPTKEEYIYLDHNSAFYPDYRSNPLTKRCENFADWPKTYIYDPQGIHQPGPVYQNNQPGCCYNGASPFYGNGSYFNGWQNSSPFYSFFPSLMPYNSTLSSFSFHQEAYSFNRSWYPHYSPFYSGNWSTYAYLPHYSSMTAPYGYGAQFGQYGQFWPGHGQPLIVPQPTCPATMTSQAAAAAAANQALAQMPNGPNYFVGQAADISAQQAIIAAQVGMGMGMGLASGAPTSIAPYKPSDGQQFWCRELDGSWTLRTYSDIALGDCAPGHWERHALSGYYFWVRQPQ